MNFIYQQAYDLAFPLYLCLFCFGFAFQIPGIPLLLIGAGISYLAWKGYSLK